MTKILIDRQVVEQALEALELYVSKEDYENKPVGNVMDALHTALAEPVQEPVATMTVREDMGADFKFSRPHTLQPGQQFYLCATTPQRPAKPVEDTDDKAASIRWQLCLLAQTEEFSEDVRNQIGRGVWLIDRLSAKLQEPVEEPVQEPVATVVARHYIDGTYAGNALKWNNRNGEDDFPVGTKLYTAPASKMRLIHHVFGEFREPLYQIRKAVMKGNSGEALQLLGDLENQMFKI